MDPCVRIATNPAPVFSPKAISMDVDSLIEAAIQDELYNQRTEQEYGESNGKITEDYIAPSNQKAAENKEVLKKHQTTKFKTPEFILSSSSEDEGPEVKKTKLIPALPTKPKTTSDPEQNRCRYTILRGEKKGLRCSFKTKDDNSHYCEKHDKNKGMKKEHTLVVMKLLQDENVNLKKRILEIEKKSDTQERLIFTSRQKIKNLEKEIENLKTSARDDRLNIQEFQNKLEVALQGLQDHTSPSSNTRKINKLDRAKTYKLINIHNNQAVLEDGKETFAIYVPKNMNLPDSRENQFLAYNKNSNMFEWLKISHP